MNAYISTFRRVEKKYRLNAQQMVDLSVALAPYIEVDEYGVTRIDSLYLDTPERTLIARSLEKPLYKEKLRVRSYGDIAKASYVFVEMKKKYDGVVYKRRVKMSALAAKAWLRGASYEEAVRSYPLDVGEEDGRVADGSDQPELSWTNKQIAREIDAMIARCGKMEPSMLITCNRSAYRARHGMDSAVRVTFDNGISYRDLHFDGEAKPLFVPLLEPGEMLMEVKCAGSMPLWLVDALSGVRAYPSSFSKYGNAYQDVAARDARIFATGKTEVIPRFTEIAKGACCA